MKFYIGVNAIQARPLDNKNFQFSRPGYEIIFPGGYVGWLPKDAFEEIFIEIIKERNTGE